MLSRSVAHQNTFCFPMVIVVVPYDLKTVRYNPNPFSFPFLETVWKRGSIRSKETIEALEEQMNVKQDNQTKERNSDDTVHDANSGDEPAVEIMIEADDSPIAS